ncbi:MAG: threonyl-tRNA synthetase editing domain-containing protein [Candidatus Thorarchaeota archaeon]
MKLLMYHVGSFWYRPYEEIEKGKGIQFGESLLVWVQSEEQDPNERVGILRKMVKNIRWLAKKHNLSSIILHSFAHMGESKADTGFTEDLIAEVASRLIERDYSVHIIPTGLNEFKMHVFGPSLAKVFKQL